ncbi:MAG: helix-turn-helix domain-containing protein [Pseudomonadota bacterium]
MFDAPSDLDTINNETPEPRSPGDRLRFAREARGESLKDVAARTHQSIETLEALEAMQTKGLSATLIRMHAVRYAKALELPGEEIADAYADARAMMRVRDGGGLEVSAAPIKRFGIPVLGGCLCLAGLAAFIFLPGADRSQRAFQNVPVSTHILAKADPFDVARRDSPSTTQTSREFALRAKRDGWIEVRGSDGTIFRSRTMSSGEVYYPRMSAGWTVTVRDASAFEVLLDGTAVMDLGKEAVPRYSINLDRLADNAGLLMDQMLAESGQTLMTR